MYRLQSSLLIFLNKSSWWLEMSWNTLTLMLQKKFERQGQYNSHHAAHNHKYTPIYSQLICTNANQASLHTKAHQSYNVIKCASCLAHKKHNNRRKRNSVASYSMFSVTVLLHENSVDPPATNNPQQKLSEFGLFLTGFYLLLLFLFLLQNFVLQRFRMIEWI